MEIEHYYKGLELSGGIENDRYSDRSFIKSQLDAVPFQFRAGIAKKYSESYQKAVADNGEGFARKLCNSQLSESVRNINSTESQSTISSGRQLKLRPDQIQARNLIGRSLQQGRRRVILKASTGFGKTELAVAMSSGALAKGKKVAFCAPYTTLINQTIARYAKYGETRVAAMQGAHELTDASQPIQVCSHQTLARRKFPDADLIFVDECHLQFDSIYKWMDEHPDVVFVGLSATPWSKGLGLRYQDVILTKTLRENIADGTLCKYEAYGIDEPDVSGVGVGADGDYAQGKLAEVMGDAQIAGSVVSNWLENAGDTQTIVFAVNVLHANQIANDFSRAGISVEVITANTPLEERKLIFARYDSRETRILVSVGVLIAGFDSFVETLILATKTKSRIRFLQMIGRGLRTAPGKHYCAVFDHGGNFTALGYPEDIDDAFHDDPALDVGEKGQSFNIQSKDEKPEKQPKTCPSCKFTKPSGVHECPKCGFAPRFGQDVEVAEDVALKALNGSKGSEKGKKKFTRGEKQEFWSQLHGWAKIQRISGKHVSDGRLAHLYREKFDCWPRSLSDSDQYPGPDVLNFIKSRNIAYAKSRKNK